MTQTLEVSTQPISAVEYFKAKLAYENALVDQRGSATDQLGALGQFWAASAYSQTAIMLARN